ncbi:MAG: hypothetical protein ACREMK_14855 [Gemmatimonadota bacterium]
MKWLEIVRFELVYQLRRWHTWVFFGVFLLPLFGEMNGEALEALGGENPFVQREPEQLGELHGHGSEHRQEEGDYCVASCPRVRLAHIGRAHDELLPKPVRVLAG